MLDNALCVSIVCCLETINIRRAVYRRSGIRYYLSTRASINMICGLFQFLTLDFSILQTLHNITLPVTISFFCWSFSFNTVLLYDITRRFHFSLSSLFSLPALTELCFACLLYTSRCV